MSLKQRLTGLSFLVGMLMLGIAPHIYGQNNQTVSGKVLDAQSMEPLPGVNIKVKRTTTGTSTNAQGKYRLSVPSLQDTLVFTFIGYEAKTVSIDGRSTIDISLQSKIVKGEQLVVTALGIKHKKRSLGYSQTTVEPKNLVTSSVTNMSNLLQGQVAGVQVRKGSGGVGSASRVTIRGVSSFKGNNQPLYVIDGIPIDNSNFFSANRYHGHAGGNGIAMINPLDIKSMTVLKGASASALYGSRARNGVILITTKSGKGVKNKEGVQVDVNSTVTTTNMLSSFNDIQHKYGQGKQGEKPQTHDDVLRDSKSSWGPKFDGSQVLTFYGGTSKYVDHPNKLKKFYRNPVSHRNSVSLSGGQNNSSFYFNATHLFSPSIYPNSNLKRTNITLRSGHTFFGKLHANIKANYIRQHHHNLVKLGAGTANATAVIPELPGNVTVESMRQHYIRPDGTEWNINKATSSVDNPYWVINKFDYSTDKNRLIGFIKLTYDITPWLSVLGRSGIDTYQVRLNNITPWGTIWRPEGSMHRDLRNVLESNTDVLLKFKHALTSDISIDATFGAHHNFHRDEVFGNKGTGFKIPGLRTISNFSGITPSYSYSSKQINSLYGMVDLSYKNYLFITGTGRNDWSSTLPDANNSYFYPSVSGSFVFSDAFSSIMPKWLSFGKVRASWASVGSDTSPYQLNLTYSLFSFNFNGLPLTDISNTSIPLATLKPTKTNAVEVGLNMSFVKNRINFDLALYHRKTINQILSTATSRPSGYSSRVLNAGRLDNKGIEISLTGHPIVGKNLLWDTSLNFTSDHSMVKELAPDQHSLEVAPSHGSAVAVTATVGHQYGTLRGTKFKRNDKGELILSDQGLPQPTEKRYILGRGTPSWTAGWYNRLHYKNWSLNFLFDVSWGSQLYSATNSSLMGKGLLKKTLIGRAECDKAGHPYSGKGCFVPKGVNSKGQPNTKKVLPSTYYGHIASKIASAFIYNANYIKFRQAKLSYSLPQSVVKKTPLHSVTISLVGRNLAYIYNSVPNVSPEAALNSGNEQGIERNGLPATRSVGLNIDLKF